MGIIPTAWQRCSLAVSGLFCYPEMESNMSINTSMMNLFLYVAYIDKRADDSHDVPIADLDGVIVAESESKLESVLLDRYEHRRIAAGLEPRNGVALEKYYDAGYAIARYDQTVLINLCIKTDQEQS